jgi:sirohydrochlorin ferrochelatase
MITHSPRLLVVAHGTASEAGVANTAQVIDAVRVARPDITVDVCFLDVAAPRLADALDDRPTVVVPLLLSTGYHVQTDIPAIVDGRAHVRVARHLGPHQLLTDALVDRLGDVPAEADVALVGAGSSRHEAAVELAEAGRLLAARLARPVRVLTLADELRDELSPGPVRVATYLLAEGRFVSTLRAALDGIGTAAPPIGVHPALVQLVWARYDETR